MRYSFNKCKIKPILRVKKNFTELQKTIKKICFMFNNRH